MNRPFQEWAGNILSRGLLKAVLLVHARGVSQFPEFALVSHQTVKVLNFGVSIFRTVLNEKKNVFAAREETFAKTANSQSAGIVAILF